MGTFTSFSNDALSRYLTMFGRGDLDRVEPITEGIENSNYRLFLKMGDDTSCYILTIVEAFSFDEIPFFGQVMSHLYRHGLPIAAPISTLDGMTTTIFSGKPAFLFDCLEGQHLTSPDNAHCNTIGEYLARSHQALGELSVTRTNPYSAEWIQKSLDALQQKMPLDVRSEVNSLNLEYQNLNQLSLPSGLIHGDLFRDNALFTARGELSGVIDFYHSCDDLLIVDLAIAINDWCLNRHGEIDTERRNAMIAGYESVRTLETAEKTNLTLAQRIGAARFLVTRLLSGDPPRKSPEPMLKLLRSLR